MEPDGYDESTTSSETAAVPTPPKSAFYVRIQPEYLVTDPLPDIPCHGDESVDKSKKKQRGQNKKRPAPIKFGRHQRICPVLIDVAVDEVEPACTYPNCAFQHDLTSYMGQKPEDVGPRCHVFETYGRCQRGVACRFASSHLVKTPDGQVRNVINPLVADKWKNADLELNRLSKDLQWQLRRKEFDFGQCDKIVDECFREREKAEAEKLATSNGRKENDCQVTEMQEDDTANDCADPDAKRLKVDESLEMYNTTADKKKKIDWAGKLYLAPLTTVGNLPFRRVCKQYGADVTCGEMAMTLQLLQGHQPEWALVQRHHTEDLFGIQVCGCSPHQMTRLARLVESNIDCDFVDINLGCPIDLVYKRGMGSGLMGRKKPLEVMIKSMTRVLSRPLTLKMRTGVYSDKNIAHQLVTNARDWGVDLVTIHGRSREQRYTKLADWNYIDECARVAGPMPVFGNGDIMNFEEYNEHMKAQPNVSGVMIARGALIKPWIFTEIKEQRHWDISAQERLDMIGDYVNFGLEHWGSDDKGVENTRRFLLEWLSFLHRYVPQGILVEPPQKINHKVPRFQGRSELETLLSSPRSSDWIKITEMFLGKVPDSFQFEPKHRANSY